MPLYGRSRADRPAHIADSKYKVDTGFGDPKYFHSKARAFAWVREQSGSNTVVVSNRAPGSGGVWSFLERFRFGKVA